MHFPFPVLVGDIGGTNARFAFVTEPGADPTAVQHLATRDFPSLEAAIADIIRHLPRRPLSVIACAAGPVAGRTVHMTNARWSIDGTEVAHAAHLEQGLILNDFEAQALALPTVKAEWVRQIGDVHNTLGGAQVVLGPGTGLGASALIEVGGRHFALPSEAGHVDFGPVGAEESAIWPHIPLAPPSSTCSTPRCSAPATRTSRPSATCCARCRPASSPPATPCWPASARWPRSRTGTRWTGSTARGCEGVMCKQFGCYK